MTDETDHLPKTFPRRDPVTAQRMTFATKPLKNLSDVRSLKQLIFCKVLNRNGDHIGTLHCIWSDPETGQIQLLGVQMGWLYMRSHLIPAENVKFDEAANTLRLPYKRMLVKGRPSISTDDEIDVADVSNVCNYYGIDEPENIALIHGLSGEKIRIVKRWQRTSRPRDTSTNAKPSANPSDDIPAQL